MTVYSQCAYAPGMYKYPGGSGTEGREETIVGAGFYEILLRLALCELPKNQITAANVSPVCSVLYNVCTGNGAKTSKISCRHHSVQIIVTLLLLQSVTLPFHSLFHHQSCRRKAYPTRQFRVIVQIPRDVIINN